MRFHWGISAVLTAGLVVSACGADDGASQTSSDGPTVLASFYPLAFVAERVAGPDANVTNLTQPGVDAHDLELTGQQVGRIADADLIAYIGGFQPAVDEAIEQNAADRAIDVIELVDLLDDDGHDDEAGHDDENDHANEEEGTHEDEDEGAHEDEEGHGDEDEGAHEDEEGHDDEDKGAHGDEEGHDDEDDHAHDLEGDPHIWQDPTNMARIAEVMADELATIAPEHADAFHDRADDLAEELAALDADYEERLANCELSVFVTTHESFGYLADRYHLEMVGIAGIEPDAEPSPARLADVQRIVEAEGVTTIFYERLVSPAVAEALADDLGIQTAVLDPIEGLTDDTADEDYLSLMRANLDALEEANGCS